MEIKLCGKCKTEKSTDEFSKWTAGPDGYQNRCKECSKKSYWENREDLVIKKRQYNKDNRDEINAKNKTYRDENPERNKSRKLKYYYNITIDDYNAMLEAQNHACAICSGVNDNTGYSLFVDHDHACCPGSRSCGDCVRGLLCNICNWAIGAMNDNPDNFDRAKQYILDHR